MLTQKDFIKELRGYEITWIFIGLLMHLCFISLYQDYYGKEGYIELVKNNWTDPSISVPIAIGILILCFITMGAIHYRNVLFDKIESKKTYIRVELIHGMDANVDVKLDDKEGKERIRELINVINNNEKLWS